MTTKSKDKREGWLAKLQVGDPVVVSGLYNGRVSKVIKITPTGKIVVDNTRYDESDNPVRYWDTTTRLEEATPDMLKYYNIKVMVSRIKNALEGINSRSKNLITHQKLIKSLDYDEVREFWLYITAWEDSLNETNEID